MARGNSKLYRVREEYIKTIPKISNYYIECALRDGHIFIKEDGQDDVHMITTTCSVKSVEIALVNIDIVMNDGTIKEQRI